MSSVHASKLASGAVRSPARKAQEGVRAAAHQREDDFAEASLTPDLGGSGVDRVVQQAGTPLPAALRQEVEARFGHDFSQVRVHSDQAAAESASALNAKAYTLGNHIVFGAGQYTPQAAAGRRLLGHELAHVIQQSRGGAEPELNPQASHEQSAHRAASQFVGGQGAIAVGGGTAVGVAREEDDKPRRSGTRNSKASSSDPLEERLQKVRAQAELAGMPRKQTDHAVAEVRRRIRRNRESAVEMLDAFEQIVHERRADKSRQGQVRNLFGEAQGQIGPDEGAGGKRRQSTGDIDRAAIEKERPHPKVALRASVAEGERLGTEGGKRQAEKEGIEVAKWNSPQHHVGDYGTGIDAWGVRKRGNKVVIIEYKYGRSGLNKSSGVRQMSNEWVGKKIAELRMVGDIETAETLLKAAHDGRLQGIVYWTREHKDGPNTERRTGAQLRDKLAKEQISETGLIQYSPSKVERAYKKHWDDLKIKEENGTLPANITAMRQQRAGGVAAPASGGAAAKNAPAAKRTTKGGTAKGVVAAAKPGGSVSSGKKAAPATKEAPPSVPAAPRSGQRKKGPPGPAAKKSHNRSSTKPGAKPSGELSGQPSADTIVVTKAARPRPAPTLPSAVANGALSQAPAAKTPATKRAGNRGRAGVKFDPVTTAPVADPAPDRNSGAKRRKANATTPKTPTAPQATAAPNATAKPHRNRANPKPKLPTAAPQGGAAAATSPRPAPRKPGKPARKKGGAPVVTTVPTTPAKGAGGSQQNGTATGGALTTSSGHPVGPTAPKKLIATQVSTSSFFKDQVRVSIAEQVGAEKPFYVTTTFSIQAGGGIQGLAQRGSGGASASASAQGTLSYSTSTWMTAQEKADYLANVARGRGGSQPEMTIIELIASGNVSMAADAIRKAKSFGGKAPGQVGDVDEVAAVGDISGGVGASRGGGKGTGGGVNVQLTAGGGIRITRTLMPEGKELYTVTIERRLGGTLGANASYNAVGGGYSYNSNEAQSDSVSVLLDPDAADYEQRKREVLAARNVDEVNAVAAKTPGGAYGRGKDVNKSSTGTASVSVFGIGLDLDQGTIDEESESVDPSGTTRRLKGGSSLGGSITVLGHRVNPESKTDSFSAEVKPDNTATGVAQSEDRSVDVGKSAQNLADSFSASPVGTVVGLATGSKEVVKERVDTEGVNLADDSFTRIAKTAEDPHDWLAAWNKNGVSRGAAQEWETTRQAVLAANGDRHQIAQAMKKWEQGDSGRSGDIERLAGDTGVAFEFPDEIADQKPVYDQLVSPGLLSGARQLLTEGRQTEARTQLEAINGRIWTLLQTIQMHAIKSTNPGKFAEMQHRLGTVRRTVSTEIAKLAFPVPVKASSDAQTPQPFVGPPMLEDDTEAKAQALAARRQASDDIQVQVGICLTNREIENRVFAEVEDELDDFYINLVFVFEKLNSLKPMYAKWDEAIKILKQSYPVQGDPPERADQFAPNRAKWQRLNKQAMK